MFKLLSDPSRLKILFSLQGEQLSVSQVIEKTGLSQPLVSFHLKVLREAGLVNASRQGTLVFNSVCDSDLLPLIRRFSKYQIIDGEEAEASFGCNCFIRPNKIKED